MGNEQPDFVRGAVRPIESLWAGWDLVRANYWLFVGITLVGVLLGSLAPFYILWGPMVCGIHLCLFRAERGKPVKFETLFKGFDYFLPSLVATLIWAVPFMVLVIAGYVVVIVTMMASMPKGPGAPPPGPPMPFFIAFGLYLAFIFVASVVVGMLTIFVYPLIVDRKLSGVQAIKTSARAVGGNLVGVFTLVLLTSLLLTAGMLACYVGAIFVLPVYFAAIAAAYRQVFPAGYDRPIPRSGEELDYDDQLELEPPPPEPPKDVP